MQILLIDNSKKELDILERALSNGYDRFKAKLRCAEPLSSINIITKLMDNYSNNNIDKHVKDLIEIVGDEPTYFVIDLFLTEIEHAKSFTREDSIEKHSGYILAKKLNDIKPARSRISLMSKLFPGENWDSKLFGRLIEKPIYKGSSGSTPILIESDILPEPKMCSKLYGLPTELDTYKALDAFQNIIFYNAIVEE